MNDGTRIGCGTDGCLNDATKSGWCVQCRQIRQLQNEISGLFERVLALENREPERPRVTSNPQASVVTPKRLVSISEAADLAGVARRTIYNWLAAGKIERVNLASGGARIVADTLFQPSQIGNGNQLS